MKKKVECSLTKVHVSESARRFCLYMSRNQTGRETVERGPKPGSSLCVERVGRLSVVIVERWPRCVSLCLSKSVDGAERQLARCEGQNRCSSGGDAISSSSNRHVPVQRSDGGSRVCMWAERVKENNSLQCASASHNHPIIKWLYRTAAFPSRLSTCGEWETSCFSHRMKRLKLNLNGPYRGMLASQCWKKNIF